MKPDKAPAYWPTRILLTVAIIATVIATASALWTVLLAPPTFGGPEPSVFGLPSNVVLAMLATALAVIGLIWTIRLVRGPREEPPPWRYRDR